LHILCFIFAVVTRDRLIWSNVMFHVNYCCFNPYHCCWFQFIFSSSCALSLPCTKLGVPNTGGYEDQITLWNQFAFPCFALKNYIFHLSTSMRTSFSIVLLSCHLSRSFMHITNLFNVFILIHDRHVLVTLSLLLPLISFAFYVWWKLSSYLIIIFIIIIIYSWFS
jgi:hypothetical protein